MCVMGAVPVPAVVVVVDEVVAVEEVVAILTMNFYHSLIFCSIVRRDPSSFMLYYWPDTISNATLWETTGQLPVKEQIKKRKWTWIGHILRRPNTCIARQALGWNPQGSRRRGRPRNTWKRDTERTIQLKGYTWNQIEQMARDRGGWRRFICGLCSETEY